MDWVQTLSIILSVIGTGYYIHRDIREDSKTQTSRIDQTNSRIDQVNSRLDQLYSMFIDLLKEQKK